MEYSERNLNFTKICFYLAGTTFLLITLIAITEELRVIVFHLMLFMYLLFIKKK